MRFSFAWIILYVIIGGIFLMINGDLALARFDVNLLFGRAEIPLLALIIAFSVLWMIILLLVDAMKVDNLSREVEKLKAQLHDLQSEEISALRGYFEAQLQETADEILGRIENLEGMLENFIKGTANPESS
ncbi:MAG TPA: hypothetical protein ENG67_01315 [candidate division WOR-3 bacterium]|uniref:DUF1049 domain-containing protein n=1 Tax=candidate division WOR-3 bacterium TaxID=2052148 RepID=A0A7C1BGA9_UNCW3|nr:MAG: hypothetical protein DRQ04_07325 [Candidatus Hydrothermae bacterium]HDM89832.1 hypothetical protein [candidate division WOR-3 bacterium]